MSNSAPTCPSRSLNSPVIASSNLTRPYSDGCKDENSENKDYLESQSPKPDTHTKLPSSYFQQLTRD